MFGTLKGRILVIAVVLAAALGFYVTRGIKLGLDLQGGMHLALEVEDREGTFTPQIRAEYTDRALQIIRNRVNQFGVEEPLIQKNGDDRIIVELAGIRDPQRAKDIVQRTAFLTFNLVGTGREVMNALPRIDQVVSRAFPAEAAKTRGAPGAKPTERVQDLMFRRQTPDSARAPGDTSQVAGDSASLLAAADSADIGRPFSSKLLDAGADGEFMVAETEMEEVNRYLALPEVQRALPRNFALRWAAEPEGRGASLYRRLYVLEERPFMTGENLEDAQAGRDPQMGFTTVSFQLNRRGGRVFERVTGQHIGDRIAIVLDNQVYSAPQVRGQIGSSGQIEMGQSPMTEARDLALVLRAGALPAPLHIIEERTVGPSLGADSINQGKWAGIVGIALIIAIMVGYYRFAGFLAVIALIVYVLVVLGGLAAFGATLTAPGIAGFLLSIGMGVDGNVLIFERIREELALGRTPRAAVDAGFDNAMGAIIDTHATTFITALILYYVGTGPVQGFAVTLAVGILASFFSSVYVTRTLFLLYIGRRSSAQPISI
jgi:protein-export membrane protein SecD